MSVLFLVFLIYIHLFSSRQSKGHEKEESWVRQGKWRLIWCIKIYVRPCITHMVSCVIRPTNSPDDVKVWHLGAEPVNGGECVKLDGLQPRPHPGDGDGGGPVVNDQVQGSRKPVTAHLWQGSGVWVPVWVQYYRQLRSCLPRAYILNTELWKSVSPIQNQHTKLMNLFSHNNDQWD